MDAEMKRMVTEDLERFVRQKDFYRRVGKAWKRGIDLEDQRDAEEEVLRMLQSNEVTLSGLLNFIDGLWSSRGDEQIIMFTTNHKERLDPALLRLGWMDVHIHMSYCSPCGFKTLAAIYLGLNDHSLFPEIEGLLGKTMVTPAEIGEQLLKNEDLESVLQGLVEFLIEKKRVAGEMEAKKLDQKEDDVEEIGNKNAEEEGESADGEMLETHHLDFYIRSQ
ncbi:hypothetical protein ACSBR2_019459 [Camellia fascicularis]